MPGFRLISNDLCPYVQRSVVILLEKGVEFDVEYIDLRDKPAWFVELSPLGKVPTLVVTGDVDGPGAGEATVLFESVVINEYLDEVTEGRMLPDEALPRAKARAWIEFGNALLSDAVSVTMAKDEGALDKVFARLYPRLDRLEVELGEGPFFLGPDVSLVDAAFVPALQRLHWANEAHAPLEIFTGRPKLARWWAALDKRESVRGATPDDLRARWEKMVARDRGGYQSVVGARLSS